MVSRFATSSESIGTAMREPVPAAQYVRMSTEHQRYSTENQSDAILQYAVRYGFGIVRTYADNGKSGLRLDGRDALKQLLIDVALLHGSVIWRRGVEGIGEWARS